MELGEIDEHKMERDVDKKTISEPTKPAQGQTEVKHKQVKHISIAKEETKREQNTSSLLVFWCIIFADRQTDRLSLYHLII